MSRVVVLGAGVAGHTAAAFARKWLASQGRGHRRLAQTRLQLDSVEHLGGRRPDAGRDASASRSRRSTRATASTSSRRRPVELHPEGGAAGADPYVVVESTRPGHEGEREEIRYDFLINATGPKLNFGATDGLGPDGHTLSVCTDTHAQETAKHLAAAVERMKRGERQRFLVGTGHGACTCQGAAFEYIVNLEFELRARGVRDRAEIWWISNEFELGDFGMGGIHLKRGGYITPSKIFTESLFAERGIRWITRAHVRKVEPGRAHYETLDGQQREFAFDFAMLLPPFAGVGLKAFDRAGADITAKVFQPNGFMKVDADYTPRPYEEWAAKDWPKTYQSPAYPNVFAAGIAFAPPHAISRPYQTPGGAPIAPAPPRTGMPSAMIGKAVARNVVDMMRGAAGPDVTRRRWRPWAPRAWPRPAPTRSRARPRR